MVALIIRIPAIVIWILVSFMLVAVGGVAGATGYRYGPYAQIEDRLLAAKELIEEKDSRIGALREELTKAQAELKEVKDMLSQATSELTKTRGELGTAQGRLQQTTGQARRAQETVQPEFRDSFAR